MMRAQVASDRINIAKPIIGKETLEQIEQILESGYSIQGTETIDSKSSKPQLRRWHSAPVYMSLAYIHRFSALYSYI